MQPTSQDVILTLERCRSDPQSLTLKYSAAKELGLRGVGPYTYSDLAYSTPQEKAEAQAMWDALHAFTGP